MKLNSCFDFDDIMEAIRFARARAKKYVEEGLTVDHFNGHDWVWYAVDLSSNNDKGIILQIFNHTDLEGGLLASS